MDHNTENESELTRLAEVGLDPHTLRRYKRLGTQQNTRSIGDYSIKGGYKDIDTIAWVSCVCVCVCVWRVCVSKCVCAWVPCVWVWRAWVSCVSVCVWRGRCGCRGGTQHTYILNTTFQRTLPSFGPLQGGNKRKLRLLECLDWYAHRTSSGMVAHL